MSKKAKKAGIVGSIILVVVIIGMIALAMSTNSFKRGLKTFKSDFTGMNRHVTAYDYSGNVLYEYTGRIDVEENDSKVLFDTEEGERVILYNAIVIIEEETN